MLAVFSVSNLDDSGAGSLRQAIDDANLSLGVDTVDLSAVSGTIRLTSGEYLITDLISIEGPGPELLTIDAQQQSRIFNITTAIGDHSIHGITLVNGKTTGTNQSGGAVNSESFGELTISNSVIRGSQTDGLEARGGAVFSGRSIRLIDSVIEDNHTTGDEADGGGVVGWRGEVHVIRSTISGNTTSGDDAGGGGALARLTAEVVDSRIEGNRTYGNNAGGGGVYGWEIELSNSVVHQNRTEGDHAFGGGIYSQSSAKVTDSTISENSTYGHTSLGGGLYFDESLWITNSTIADNYTEGQFASGGGIDGTDLATIIRSTISGNETRGDNARGGGIRFTGEMTLIDSSVSNNRTMGYRSGGGGMRVDTSLTIENSTISGNSTLGDEANGGGIVSSISTSIRDSVVSNNSTAGDRSYGGGMLAASSLTMSDSTISGNSTWGDDSGGGGFLVTGVTSIYDSVVSNNSTAGYHGFGGGAIFQGETEVNHTTVIGNTTGGTVSSGGGIHSISPVTLINTTVAGNSTQNDSSPGGGIVAFDSVLLQQSTVSGNRTSGIFGYGGGIAMFASLSLQQSTITDNRVSNPIASGGGIWSNYEQVHLFGSIVAANQADVGPDIGPTVGALYADFTLIEQANLPTIVGNNNLIGVEANLQPLADNGGGVLTHALLPTSPAVNGGNPNLADPNPYDQRGFAFARVVDGRIDMGALEAGAASVDFDGNDRVDGEDFLIWQRNYSGGTTHADGDADIDQDVDDDDLAIWVGQFGLFAPEAADVLSSVHESSSIAAKYNVSTDGPNIQSLEANITTIVDSGMRAMLLTSRPDTDARDHVFSFLESEAVRNDVGLQTVRGLFVRTDADHDEVHESRYTIQHDTDTLGEANEEMEIHFLALAKVFEHRVFWRRLLNIGLLVALMLIPKQSAASVNPMVPAPIIPLDGRSSDLFGDSLMFDGETLVVGAPYHRHGGIARGAAYLYQFESGKWQQQQELKSPIGEGSSTFGSGVGVSGSAVVVGDPSAPYRGSGQNLRGAGAAFVFDQTPSGWNDVVQLIPDDPSVDAGFGGSVAISGATALIGVAGGSGAAYVFEEVAGHWQQQAKLTPSEADGFGLSGDFGEKVLLSGDTALVSARSQDAGMLNSGAVFAFEKGDQGWHETDMLVPSDPLFRGKFGFDFDLSDDVAIVGRPAGGPAANGPFQGAAYIFERQGDRWIEAVKLEASDGFADDGFGTSVAVFGKFAAVGAQHFAQNRIYLFEKTGGSWLEIGHIRRDVPFSTDQFGGVLSLHAGTLVAGARLATEAGVHSGAVYVTTIPEPPTISLVFAMITAVVAWRTRKARLVMVELCL